MLKRYDRKQFTRGPVTIKKGTHVVIDKDEAYAHGYHPDAGHFRFIHHSDPDIKNDHDKFHKPGVHKIKEATVKEISKGLAKRYVGKAARDVYFKGRSQATKDAISQLGGPDTDYKKSPERKAAMRMRGIDRATKRLAKKEADDYHYSTGERIKKKPVKKEGMSDAEKAAHQKAIDAFRGRAIVASSLLTLSCNESLQRFEKRKLAIITISIVTIIFDTVSARHLVTASA